MFNVCQKHLVLCITGLLLVGCSDLHTTVEGSADVVGTADVNDTVSTADAAVDSGPTPPEAAAPPVAPTPPAVGDLLIEEFYYSGASPGGGADHYFSDQFIELVNTTDRPLDVSGVMVADVSGAAGAINPGMQPDSYRETHPALVVMESVWRIPEGVALAPQGRLIVAHDGTNHQPFSTIDLSGADFEAYVAEHGKDDDHPTVQNLESVVFNGGYDWLMTVFGPSVVVLAPGTPLGSVPGVFGELPTAPTSAVLDGVEAVMDGESGAFKRLPDTVDSGFLWVSGTYVGESLHRRKNGNSWQDTNDSWADFEVGPPDPGVALEAAGVFAETWIELGTGMQAFEALKNGDTIELVAGIQGGWHVDVSLRFAGFGPQGILLSYEGFDAVGQSISYETQALLSNKSLLPEGEGWQRVGDRVVLDIVSPDEVVGAEAVLQVTATLDGQVWSDERTVTIVDAQ
ncbi:MAG: DUF4876 domain-containing protein [Myxococcota bacterium]